MNAEFNKPYWILLVNYRPSGSSSAMKNIFLLFASWVLSPASFSQQTIRMQPCQNEGIAKQADSLKQLLGKDGFELLKESSLTMESDYEMPVIVPLQKGSLYHFVFIGEPGAKLYEARMFDREENQVAMDNKKNDEGNIVRFSHVTDATDIHSLRVVQANKKKKKGLCGYVMLLKKVKR